MVSPATRPDLQLPLDPPQPLRCQACRFWEEINPEAGLGACRIRAPHAVRQLRADDLDHSKGDLYPFAISAVWPLTAADDWCGEGVRQ